MSNHQATSLTTISTREWITEALATIKPRHWLLDSIYGRELLKDRLCQLVPDLQISGRGEAHELDPIFDRLIDDLRVRDWQRPRTLKQRLTYLRDVLRLTRQVQRGEVL